MTPCMSSKCSNQLSYASATHNSITQTFWFVNPKSKNFLTFFKKDQKNKISRVQVSFFLAEHFLSKPMLFFRKSRICANKVYIVH